ncbi:MAG: SRPBCC domain-containing protein [Parafilimonas sp.]|nr:SRPBCC domain-containing protein [Parafilimonas sp.]
MEIKPLIVERIYTAASDKIWEALTDKNKMKQWYFDIAGFKPEVGFEFTFNGGSDEKTYVHFCKVIEVIPNKKLKHSWHYQGYEGMSYVTWELFDEGEKTQLKLTHEGLETFPQVSKDFSRESFTQGWNYILGTSLKTFLEKQS